MVVGELEYKINEQSKEIKALKKDNCELQNINNDLIRQQEILFNLFNELISNGINFNDFQLLYFKLESIINNAPRNKDITNELIQVKQQANNNKMFRYALLMLEFKCNYIPDKKTRLILFS